MAARRSRIAGGILTAVLGLLCIALPLGRTLERSSYDILQTFSTGADLSSIVVVGLDAQPDRSSHAAILERLAIDQATLVVSDVLLVEPRGADEDARLAMAIRQNQRVLLAGGYQALQGVPLAAGGTVVAPLDLFRTNALGWGLAQVLPDSDGIVRRHYSGTAQNASLPWAAAEAAGAKIARVPANRHSDYERWMKYYGPAGSISALNWVEATNQAPGYFRDKFVFLGFWRSSESTAALDQSPTPFTRSDGVMANRVELLATTFLNLLWQDWVVRCPWWLELLMVLGTGIVFGIGLRWLRPWHAAVAAVGGSLAIAGTALVLFWLANVWFTWLVPAIIQVPCALIFSLAAHRHTVQSRLEPSTAAKLAASGKRPAIPDHVLERRIGEGAYGEVWLARNVVKVHHAVKVVYRERFVSDAPYEREFKGIQSFMPVSSLEQGFLKILHVGRNDAEAYFFYIMEAADDVQTGQSIDPSRYVPRNLHRDVESRGALPAAECLSVVLPLSHALSCLHQAGLVHRDIKPANIIYIRGIPKLADIGLVTPISRPDGPPSLVGTEGFLLPQQAGQPQGDLYALGKVLYVALSGLPAAQFPEWPSRLEEGSDAGLRSQLNEVAWKCCGLSLRTQYSTALDLYQDLCRIQRETSAENAQVSC